MSQLHTFAGASTPPGRSSTASAPTSFDGNIRKFLEEHVLFKNLDQNFIQTLSTSMQSRIYNPSEFVIRKGEIGRAMFFVLRGDVEVISEDGVYKESRGAYMILRL
jgi:F-box/leucine-rich repeat protein 7